MISCGLCPGAAAAADAWTDEPSRLDADDVKVATDDVRPAAAPQCHAADAAGCVRRSRYRFVSTLSAIGESHGHQTPSAGLAVCLAVRL